MDGAAYQVRLLFITFNLVCSVVYIPKLLLNYSMFDLNGHMPYQIRFCHAYLCFFSEPSFALSDAVNRYGKIRIIL